MSKRLLAGLAGLSFAVAIGCSEDSTNPEAAGSDGAGAAAGSAGAGGAAAGAGGAGTGGSGGAPCDDSGPDPLNHTAGTCSNLGETALVAYCNEAIDKLKPGVAYASISCLAVACLRGPPCTTDQYHDAAEQCLLDALAGACADESADATCTDIETSCNATAEECHPLIDGMTEPTRTAVVSCAQADCATGLEECVKQVLAPN